MILTLAVEWVEKMPATTGFPFPTLGLHASGHFQTNGPRSKPIVEFGNTIRPKTNMTKHNCRSHHQLDLASFLNKAQRARKKQRVSPSHVPGCKRESGTRHSRSPTSSIKMAVSVCLDSKVSQTTLLKAPLLVLCFKVLKRVGNKAIEKFNGTNQKAVSACRQRKGTASSTIVSHPFMSRALSIILALSSALRAAASSASSPSAAACKSNWVKMDGALAKKNTTYIPFDAKRLSNLKYFATYLSEFRIDAIQE